MSLDNVLLLVNTQAREPTMINVALMYERTTRSHAKPQRARAGLIAI